MNERYASGLAVMTETTVAGMADASKARADGSGLKITESSEMNDSREDKAAGPVAVMLPSEAKEDNTDSGIAFCAATMPSMTWKM